MSKKNTFTKDDKVYRKADNGRYVAYGICCEPSNLPDGIWYVRHTEHGRATTSIPYMQGIFKMGEAKEVDITKLCGMENLCDEILSSREFNNAIDYEKGYSISDIVHACVKILVDKAEKEKENHD